MLWLYEEVENLKNECSRSNPIAYDQLTTIDKEAAQALGKFFSSVFLNERDGHDTQSEELVQEEDWNIIINEDTVMSKLMGLTGP